MAHLPQHVDGVLGSELETGERLLVTQVLVSVHEEGVNAALAERHLSQVVATRIHAAKTYEKVGQRSTSKWRDERPDYQM